MNTQYSFQSPPHQQLIPIAPSVGIEHKKITFNPDGSVESVEQNAVSPSQVKDYLSHEQDKLKVIQDTNTMQLQMKLSHEKDMIIGQQQFMLQAMGYEITRQQLMMGQAYISLQQQVVSLLGEVKQLQSKVAELPSPEQTLSTCREEIRGRDICFAEDAEYEIVQDFKAPELENVSLAAHIPLKKFSIGRCGMEENLQPSSQSVAIEQIENESDVIEFNVLDHGIEYDRKNGRFNNVPMNVMIEYPYSKVICCQPDVGKTVLDPKECDGTVAPSSPGWKAASYTARRDVSVDVFGAAGLSLNMDDKSSIQFHCTDEYRMCAFTHLISQPCTQFGADVSHPYWEAFDIPFNPLWKMLVAKYMNGLTSGNIAIVRLLSANPDGFSSDYMTMYWKGTQLSKYFNTEWEKRTANGEERPQIDIRYNISLMSGSSYAHIVSALFYAYSLNQNRNFLICEQIMDYEHDGRNRILLSKGEPKTEIREEWNVFEGTHPESVYSNYPVEKFFCRYDAEAQSFVITRVFKSTHPPKRQKS